MRAIPASAGRNSTVSGGSMSSKDKYGKFKKKDYVRTIRAFQNDLCEMWGYIIKPFLFETRLRESCLMEFYHCEAGYAIFYDYKQFKDMFGHRSFETQKAYAAAILAHAMRHYYQHRQMIAVKPKESEKTIALWQENERDPISLEEGASVIEFHLQPLELDASLFEYVFGAEAFGVILLQAVAGEWHLNAMEKLYVEYFGETDEELFGDEVRKYFKALDRAN